jgi:DNA polymerase (family 10)
VQKSLKGLHLFSGIESDILADGSLDYDDKLLARLDVVVVSIHSRMTMDREAMTRRICRVLEHPAATILGHPTGRLLLQREPYGVDLERVFEVAAAHDVAIEINAHPMRLDLDWTQIPKARAAGCRFAICPDSHAAADLGDMRWGVGIARKGWLGPRDVVNTMSATAFGRWLKDRKKKKK